MIEDFDDIVYRLRDDIANHDCDTPCLMEEAADEIEWLKAEVKWLESKLKAAGGD